MSAIADEIMPEVDVETEANQAHQLSVILFRFADTSGYIQYA